MATNDHSEGVRLQAERVVRAYKDLVGSAKSGEFPIDHRG